ncbi:hypothetical protein IAW_05127 [Bacillus cereus str. Schrouff]|nr:hypothetical protein IAW_05127 [Bacillus cereus str. Schrouff]EOO82365.1 hypothetical protein IGY_05222 [Bacillus cereus K-5975c]SEJ89159.1 hypothetical protein SAMN04487780_12137 [Bacillus thuringiensis]
MGYVEIKVENPPLFYIKKMFSHIIYSFMLISDKKGCINFGYILNRFRDIYHLLDLHL